MESINIDDETAELIQKYNVSVSEAVRFLYCSFACEKWEKCSCPLKSGKPRVSQPLLRLPTNRVEPTA